MRDTSRRTLHAMLAPIALVLVILTFARPASAVPSFARQTGYTCSQCHTTPPELTPLGRQFKLNGYTITGMPASFAYSNLWRMSASSFT